LKLEIVTFIGIHKNKSALAETEKSQNPPQNRCLKHMLMKQDPYNMPIKTPTLKQK
jgi:hypothetical protein